MTSTPIPAGREIDDECGLCGGCGEVEVDRRDTLQRDTVPCPDCIAHEIAEERAQNAAALSASSARVKKLEQELAEAEEVVLSSIVHHELCNDADDYHAMKELQQRINERIQARTALADDGAKGETK